MITINNYYNATKGIYKGCKKPKRQPDYTSMSSIDGSVSSMYWYGEDKRGIYVIRCSDHWSKISDGKITKYNTGCGTIASCVWFLKTNSNIIKDNLLSGKIYLTDFKKI